MFFLNMFLLIPILIDSLARTCHKNTIKSAKSGPERMLSHRCTQPTPPMGLMLGIPWGIERLKYSPEEDTGSDGTVASHSTFYTLNGNFRVSLSFSFLLLFFFFTFQTFRQIWKFHSFNKDRSFNNSQSLLDYSNPIIRVVTFDIDLSSSLNPF